MWFQSVSARGGLKSPGKPFEISKRAVWKAWEKVRANNGAPGVDGESVADFEKDLKGAGVADNDECACGQVVGEVLVCVEHCRLAHNPEVVGSNPTPATTK